VEGKKPHHSPRRAQIHGDRSLQGGVEYMWIFSMEFASLHHSDAWNFELIPRFWKISALLSYTWADSHWRRFIGH